uniref:Speckle-type POZ protein n=1 Tax=Philodina roseola TaxID=96448 RepID=B2ZF99_PHIRO|nr:speckle-type POZ protein [Philodina roseola]
METTNRSASSTTNRQIQKRTFSESDSSSRTERHLCSFSHLWIINYLSSYLDDPNCSCLQSESFSPVNTSYSNTRWTLKLYPRGLNEKQQSNNNNLAIFLKYLSGNLSTIKAKAEFSVVSRNNELVMLRSTNFHLFTSGNDWGYSVKIRSSYYPTSRLSSKKIQNPGAMPPIPMRSVRPSPILSLISNRSVCLSDKNRQNSSRTVFFPVVLNDCRKIEFQIFIVVTIFSFIFFFRISRCKLFAFSEKDRWKSLEIYSNHLKTLLDNERFTDVNIHVVAKENSSSNNDDENRRKIFRRKRNSTLRSFEPICTRRTTRLRTAALACSSSNFVNENETKEILFDAERMKTKYSNVKPLSTFHAHRSILIARSPSFAQHFRLETFSSQNLKSSSIDFYIDDLDVSTVGAMLLYIYTGRLPTCKTETNEFVNPIDLFRAAVKFQLNELRDAAKMKMLETLKIENAIEMLEVSDQTNDVTLKQHVFSFIRSNASAVSKTNNWFNVSKRHPHLIIDAFRSLVEANSSTIKNNVQQHSTSLTTTKKNISF